MINKIIKWLIFSVLVGLLPLFLNTLQTLIRGDRVILETLLVRGDLLLIGNAITAGAIGELFARKNNHEEWVEIIKTICGGLSVIIIIINSFWFSQIEFYTSSEQTFDESFVALASPIFFIANLVTSLGCVISSEL